MTIAEALAAFSLAAGLLTLTPGLDTALVLRTAAVEGPRPAMAAGCGITLGVLLWGLIAAAGLGALLTVSEAGFRILQIAGAVYLVWLGAGMVRGALSGRAAASVAPAAAPAGQQAAARWFLRGLMTNLLNPKVGLFYVGFLPQFMPAGVSVVAFGVLLAAIHGAMGLLWFAALTGATRPLSRWLMRPAVGRGLDLVTGTVLIGFGLRLAFSRRWAG
ncbi:LysE family translocator [Pseudoxanthobacter sp.]|uniref:LysE family translocator n=1 Tax=Pseudoxanthobacter sp. TaxID=1925742 RepID=UPI002FE1FFBD